MAARTQGHHPYFTGPLRDHIVTFIAREFRVSDAWLLAYAIMPNHLHLVVRQGDDSLGRLMQPILRRTALLVQRTYGTEGHVFERRYRERHCSNPRHVRNSIVYAHLNPVRAGLVALAGGYRWSSHRLYATGRTVNESMAAAIAVDEGLRLFAPRDGLIGRDIRRAYRRYVAWRVAYDRHRDEEERGEDVGLPPTQPPLLGGDMHWARVYAPLFQPDIPPHFEDEAPAARRVDLSEIAKRAVAELAPDLELERVRSAEKTPAVVRVRHALVRRMNTAGHTNRAIARYLRVSDQCVSNILVAHRRNVSP